MIATEDSNAIGTKQNNYMTNWNNWYLLNYLTLLWLSPTNVREKDEPRNRQGAVYKINCSDCHASYIGETGRNLTTRLTKHKRATRKGDVNNHIAEHHWLTNHTIDWDSAQCLTYGTNYFNDWPWKAGLPTWNRLPTTGVNHYRHHTNDSFTTLILQTNRAERPNFTNGSRPTNHDWPTPLES